MGLLDQIAGALGGSQPGGGAQSPLIGSVLSMLGSGGLQGIEKAFQANGLGEVIKSWIGTGANLPVSPAQIQQALGPSVSQLAQQHGLSADAVSQHLAQLLPGLVDKLTPGGQVPQGDALGQALGALKGLL
jgi:uncharacterized protein YidB (DUF937 family)